MKWLKILAPAAMIVFATAALGETVHLRGGERVTGKIIGIDDETITVESEKGYGTLQIPRDEVLLVEYTDVSRQPEKRIGVGYHHRSTADSPNGAAAEYAVDAISLKYWLDDTDSVDVQFGFFNNSDSGDTVLEVFSLDLRYAQVFKRQAELDLYYGGSVGFLSVEDNTNAASPVDDSGFGVRAFVGVEIFFVTLPNLGIAAEVGIGTQQVGERSTTSVSTTSFPSFSARYYF